MIDAPLALSSVALFTIFTAGFALGSFYFGLLWWTVRRLPETQQPARLFLTSFFGRTATLLLGFYWVMDGHWEKMLACLVGFIVARSFLIRRFQPRPYHRDITGT